MSLYEMSPRAAEYRQRLLDFMDQYIYPNEAVYEQQDVGSFVGSSDADVVDSAVVSQGHYACFVDAIGALYRPQGVAGDRAHQRGCWADERQRAPQHRRIPGVLATPLETGCCEDH